MERIPREQARGLLTRYGLLELAALSAAVVTAGSMSASFSAQVS
ncbi:MAG TPA: hypothetical protein VGP57_10860 [Actinoplanes sp.]|nr:hypothetical protein [Actinoplanes sp.]